MPSSTFVLHSRRITLALALSLLLGGSAQAGGELLPLEPGMVVVTKAAEWGGPTPTKPQTVVVFDTRDPECNPNAEIGIHWAATDDWNQMPNATGRVEDEWTTANLGASFGVALDDADAPNIYVTTGPIYTTQDPVDGRVSKIDGRTGAITRLVDLPNEGTKVGLGNICFDAAHQQLHVTNFADGKLYRLATDGTILSTFDPFLADTGSPGFAPLSERIWGVATNGERVFYGTWRQDNSRRTGPVNGVFSVALDASGDYLPATEREEFLVDPIAGRSSMPVVDIAFSTDGDYMLIGERTMAADSGSGAHNSRVLGYRRVGDAWVLAPDQYSVGHNDAMFFFGWNASGGVDLDQCVSDPLCTAEAPKAYATGDALIFDTEFAYGLQIFPWGGGPVESSYVIDLDDDLVSQDKTGLGDVEVVRHVEVTEPIEPPDFEVAWVEDPSECNLALRVVWDAAVFDPPDAGTYRVYRSELSCVDAVSQGPVASGLTELSWIDRDTETGVPYFYVVEAVSQPSGGGCTAIGAPLTTQVCLDPPMEDMGQTAWPDVVWDVLRARHEGDVVTFYWPGVRSLLTDEHFHVLKTVDDASSAFTHVNGEGHTSDDWTEEDRSSWLQFFDLRVANRCEDLSIDEYPPSR